MKPSQRLMAQGQTVHDDRKHIAVLERRRSHLRSLIALDEKRDEQEGWDDEEPRTEWLRREAGALTWALSLVEEVERCGGLKGEQDDADFREIERDREERLAEEAAEDTSTSEEEKHEVEQ